MLKRWKYSDIILIFGCWKCKTLFGYRDVWCGHFSALLYIYVYIYMYILHWGGPRHWPLYLKGSKARKLIGTIIATCYITTLCTIYTLHERIMNGVSILTPVLSSSTQMLDRSWRCSCYTQELFGVFSVHVQ